MMLISNYIDLQKNKMMLHAGYTPVLYRKPNKREVLKEPSQVK